MLSSSGAHAFLVKPYAIGPLFEMLKKRAPQESPTVIPINEAA